MTDSTTPLATTDVIPEVPAPSSNVTLPENKPKFTTRLNAEERAERARKAGKARAAKAAALATQVQIDPLGFPWSTAPIADAEKFLANLRAEATKGAEIIQRRYGQPDSHFVPCYICGCDIPPGKWAMQKYQRDSGTGLLKNIFYCSANCVARENLRIQGVRNVPR